MTVMERTAIDCPVCGNSWCAEENLVQGELLDCEDCGCELEVTCLLPLTVEEAPQEEEDWGQ